jgi:hypothetical protein
MTITTCSVSQAFNQIIEKALGWRPVPDTNLVETINASITITDPTDRLVILDTDWPGFEPYLAAQWAWYSWMHQIPLIKFCYPAAWSRFESPTSSGCKSNYGAYVWQEGQFMHCMEVLKKDPQSRRAVIMFNRHEAAIADNAIDYICTNCLQFLLRDGRLHVIVTMRSNEVFFNFRTDVVFFTMLQEIAAQMLNVNVGNYHHNVGSLHINPDMIKPYTIRAITWPRLNKDEFQDLMGLRTFFTSGHIQKSEFSLTQKLAELLKFYGSTSIIGA